MRNACRPMGRFFCLLKWLAAVIAMAATMGAQTDGPTMTRVLDTVYRADGTTQAGHQYSLVTQLFVNEAHRVHETYSSSTNVAGNGRGGDTVAAAMRVVLSVHDVDPNSPGTLALPATVLYDGVLGATPAFALYALANGNDLHAQIAYTRLQKIADVEVRSMIPGQSFRSRLPGALYDGGECYVSSAGELHFYPPYPPQANEQIVVSYRASARAIAAGKIPTKHYVPQRGS